MKKPLTATLPGIRPGVQNRSTVGHVWEPADGCATRAAYRRALPAYIGKRLAAAGICLALSLPAFSQQDQGTITGSVQDASGAVVPGAQVTLTNTGTGFALQTRSDANGVYIFSPIKIGDYTVSAGAPGFETTTQENLHLDLQQRLNVAIKLKPGNISETVTVTTAPSLMQTEQGSVGQVLSTRTINNTPLNGRNWVYIAQLTAGVDPPAAGSRGLGTGDFSANGQRSEQNNFILDGVDNNVNVVDFLNGASYVVRPPPDALAEFKIDTGDFSAEFGHSAGAVLNVSIKSGTNQIHGDLWEYLRNDVLDARDFDSPTIPKYRENQFGATLGFPILRNKLFFFGDVEANRIVFGQPDTLTVPTPLMRQGNFTELLSPALTGSTKPIQLYEPGSGGTTKLVCNSQNNVYCANQIDAVAQRLLNLYPAPNANGGDTYNNYITNRNSTDNTWQWDTRTDWNIAAHDQAFARFSYTNERQFYPPPLGPVLDGGVFGGDGNQTNLGENFVGSETHIFNPNLVNELRFGYNYGHFTRFQVNASTDEATALGLGGVPFSPSLKTGGLPRIGAGSLTMGSPNALPTVEGENVYQILDNVTKIVGNHSLKLGLSLQSIRFATSQVGYPRGLETFTALSTSNLGATFTGDAVADLLADQMDSATVAPLSPFNDLRWYRAAYFQDDWKVNSRLALNLGLRYDYTQPYSEMAGRQANFLPTGPLGVGAGSGVYQIPAQSRNSPLGAVFPKLLAGNNVSVQYVDNPALVAAQKTNFAPRIGFAFELDPRTTVRGGFGIFYGGLENRGGNANLAQSFPFQGSISYPSPTCKAGYGNCLSNGLTLETGFATFLTQGLLNSVTTPVMKGESSVFSTPYSMEENLTVERSLSNNLVASVAFVGSAARHLQVFLDSNGAEALLHPGSNIQPVLPFPSLNSTSQENAPIGESNYNSLQSRIQKRYAGGLNFLATYTWSHSLDDAPEGGLETGAALGDTNLVPISYDYSNSLFDVRQRFTFNGFYELPFGKGRAFMSHGRVADLLAGGWAANLTFVAQTGEPFTVTPANITAPAGIVPRALLVRDPFKAGGAPDPTNPTTTCAVRTRTLKNWYNPCAFANPPNGTSIPASGPGSQITGPDQVLAYFGGKRNEIAGPGYEGVNMSAFKDFATDREQLLEFRADVFNLLNTPDYGSPSTTNDGNLGGLITTARSIQNLTPDARFFQISLKYIF